MSDQHLYIRAPEAFDPVADYLALREQYAALRNDLEVLVEKWRWPGRQHLCYPKDCADQLDALLATHVEPR
jgi:hypothetical protein